MEQLLHTSPPGHRTWRDGRAMRPLRLLANIAVHIGPLSKQAGLVLKRNGGLTHSLKKVGDLYRRNGAVGLRKVFRSTIAASAFTSWYDLYRSGADYAGIGSRGTARFTIVMPVYKVRASWLEEAIGSVTRQTYPHWELICVDDHSQDETLSAILRQAASADPRVRLVMLDRNQGVSRATNAGIDQASGDYILFMDHDDILEPHALARLGDAAFQDNADILYGDEVVTDDSANVVLGVQARPVFSHTFYLSHPYIVHPLAVRTALARRIGGLDVSLDVCQDIDFVLRALEIAQGVTHVPDILYRWRTIDTSLGHTQKTAVMTIACAIKTEHLRRLGFAGAEVGPGRSFNTFAVTYFAEPKGRILAIVPTKNRVNLLRLCVETVRRTTSHLDLTILVVDHQSDDSETVTYLRDAEAASVIEVLPYVGTFNYSAINNHAVTTRGAGYDHFLFLNNDIEATEAGWLDAMLDLGSRADVGAVGATLLYPDGKVQHSGVIVGMHGSAEHAFKTLPYGPQTTGYLNSLHATRDYSAVTAACMLVPAEAFRAVGGYDERLQVGFNDTDLCLRIGLAGYRVINCAEAVLVHHESASRGKSLDGRDSHPEDSTLFRSRYADLLAAGDPQLSPLLSRDNPTFVLDMAARLGASVRYDTVTDILPKGRRGAPP